MDLDFPFWYACKNNKRIIMGNDIAIIIPYFGKFPKWMSLFIEGCRHNGFIDFIIYSDDILKCESDNIIYHQISFENYCQHVSESLGIDFNPKSPYKLCGVKPFYGFIHQIELKGYKFWGFCDIDLVFGELSVFSQDNLQKYDVLSTDWNIISGPLCIFKNTDYYRTLSFKIPDWQEKLMSEEMIPLDEKYLSDILAVELKLLRGIDTRILRLIFPLKWVKRIDKVLSWPVHFVLRKRRLLFNHFDCSPEIGHSNMSFIYTNHKVFDRTTGKELPYLHFLFFKKNKYRDKYLWTDETKLNTEELDYSRKVYIDEKGIYNV